MRKSLLILGVIGLFIFGSCEKEPGTCRCKDGYSGQITETEADKSSDCDAMTEEARKNGYPMICSFVP